MIELDQLARIVASDPQNIELRLVYADALEEAGSLDAATRQRQIAAAFAAWPTAAATLMQAAAKIVQSLLSGLRSVADEPRQSVEARDKQLQDGTELKESPPKHPSEPRTTPRA